MTSIADHLDSKLSTAKAIGFGSWLLVCVGFFLPEGSSMRALLLIPFVVFVASVQYVLFFLKCPRCRTRLGPAMGSATKPKFCPGCGVSFDAKL